MGEVEVVRAVVERLLRDSTLQGPQDIGVISAYSAQVCSTLLLEALLS